MSIDPTQPSVGAQLVFNESLQGWEVVSTGQAVASTVIHAEMRSHAILTSTMFNNMTVNMYAGDLAIGSWQNAMFAGLKDGHIGNAMFANGGSELSSAAIARVEATLASEAEYLAKFAKDVSNGTVSELQARARAKQYAQAMEQSYWNEWKADITNTPNLAHLPLLTQSPGDGQTQCLGNCQCILEVTPQGIYWRLFPAKHCDDCEVLAAGSPYRSE